MGGLAYTRGQAVTSTAELVLGIVGIDPTTLSGLVGLACTPLELVGEAVGANCGSTAMQLACCTQAGLLVSVIYRALRGVNY